MGTTGMDNFTIKALPDGAAFWDVAKCDKQTGRVSFSDGSPDFRERLTGNQTYYVRPDARYAILYINAKYHRGAPDDAPPDQRLSQHFLLQRSI
jgi:hypothetical protein